MRIYEPGELDIRIARDVLDNDVWLENGTWMECEYWPVSDGYGSSTRPLRAYSQYIEHALDLREVIHRRSGVLLNTHPARTHDLCLEALALNGIARYQPSEALREEVAQSQWKERTRWAESLHDALNGMQYRERGPHIYIVSNPDAMHEIFLYVGQTTVGVQKRLRQHISSGSPVGRRMASAIQFDETLVVEVVVIKAAGYNSLNMAEQHFIRELRPLYNVAHTSTEGY